MIQEEVIRHICIPRPLSAVPDLLQASFFSATELQAAGWGGVGGGGWLGLMTWVECDYSHFARSSLGGLWQSCDMMDLVPEYKEV